MLQEVRQIVIWIWLPGELLNFLIIFQIDEISEPLNLPSRLIPHLLYPFQELFYLVAPLRKQLDEFPVYSSPLPKFSSVFKNSSISVR